MSLPLLLAAAALAKSPGWFRSGAGGVQIGAEPVEVPLLRGPTTRYLPAVAVEVRVDALARPALAVLDVAGGGSRLSSETASALGVEVRYAEPKGEPLRYAVLDEVRIGEVVLREVRVRIDDEAPGLVLGFGSIDELAVAILASAGAVRFAGEKGADALLRSVGEPLEAERDARDELTLRVPGALRWGAATVEATVHLRTDLATSRVAPSSRLPEPTPRSGGRYHDVGARVGEVWLPDTWIREDPALADPDPSFAGALGYDVLFAVDLAVAPGGRVAFRAAGQARSTDATGAAVEAAKQRYAQEEEAAAGTADATVAPKDERVEIGFDGPRRQGLALGDPGNPVVRDRNLDLAETLWQAGAIDEALPYYLAASRFAGDHCGAHLLLGVRRLASTGPALLDKDMVAKLAEDPIERAAALWDAWLGLDEDTREALAAGRELPPGTLQVWQPPICGRSWGLLAAIARARGQLEQVERIEVEHLARDPAVAYARALAALAAGRSEGAAPLLEAARRSEALDPADLAVAEAVTRARAGDVEGLIAVARDLPGTATDHPLTAALGLLSAAQATRDPAEVTRRLWRADERWIPGVLVHAVASRTPPPPWDSRLEERTPHSPLLVCQRAVHLALHGETGAARVLLRTNRWPALADWWAATAVAERLAGDHAASEQALRELRLRFPLLPATDLGLGPPPPPPPPPAPPPRRR